MNRINIENMTLHSFDNRCISGRVRLFNNLEEIYPCDGLIIYGCECSTVKYLEKNRP